MFGRKSNLPSERMIKTILNNAQLKLQKTNPKTLKIYKDTLDFASKQKKMPSSYIRNKILTPLNQNSENYEYFFVLKSSGTGIRLIANPKDELREIQSYIKENILEQLPISDIAFAYIPKEKKPEGWTWQQAIFETAGNRDYFGEADIKSFFDHITTSHVYKMFRTKTDYSIRTCKQLTAYCTNMGTVPQGSVSGPTISNIIMYDTDVKLKKAFQKHGWTLGRYSDNYMFGCMQESKKKTNLDFPLNTIRKTLLKEEFQLHEEKCWVASNDKGHPIMNLSISQKLNIPSKTYDELRAATYNFVVKKRVPIQYKGNLKGYYISLRGKLSYWTKIAPKVKKTADMLSSVNPDKLRESEFTYIYRRV